MNEKQEVIKMIGDVVSVLSIEELFILYNIRKYGLKNHTLGIPNDQEIKDLIIEFKCSLPHSLSKNKKK